jgi:hypothetical protein
VEEPSTKSTLSNGDIATNGDTSAQNQDEDDTEWTVRWKFILNLFLVIPHPNKPAMSMSSVGVVCSWWEQQA